ncbi:SusC/RagA family TonB-linked outer membrane protein [Zhouia amylolytica]|uniref:SusC/RagA family TonB-linked outer membrane protein n=1 Tax=Zhouia amylolytica TaxID=376730 RepID=UPI0020CE012B|nr:TonB-dependent receptor [Zhouia amylolytica]MCQ0110504.1 TonB-dependent receptor [Zhouia amylolytica]
MKKILSFLFVVFFLNLAIGQERDISGTVVDAETKVPIPGASVMIKNTTVGVATDFDGKFSIKAKSGDVLEISYLGYKTQELSIGNQSNFNVQLQSDAAELDEVVVVGYGKQKKVNLTGSISSVKSEDLVKNATSNVSSALSGRMAGVVTVQSSGEPGADIAQIRIRGLSSLNSNSPLVLVDGIPRDLNSINPNDIESISVLKDAAAGAIYGMRSANGVILVTTKRGGDSKPQLSVNSYSGIQVPTRMPDFLNSYNYARLLNEANANDGTAAAYDQTDLDLFRDGSSPDTHPNTDWIDETLKSNSLIQSHDLSVRGSYEKVRYFTSLGYLYQDGLYENNRYDRFNFRSNIDVDISNRINLQADFSGDIENTERPAMSAGTLFSRIMRTPPTEVNQFSNGGYSQFSLYPAINEGGYNKSEDFAFQSRLALNIDLPIDGLDFTGQVAYDRSAGGSNENRDNFVGRRKIFTVPTSYTSYNANTGEFNLSTPADRGETASLSESMAQGYQLTTEAILNYSKSFGEHDLGAKLIYSRTATEYNILSAGRTNFLGTSVDFFVAGDEATRTNSNATYETAIMGYAGRFTYSYADKYLFEFNGRYDGSYKFSEDSRFDFFPSFSLGWRLSQEEFLKNSEVVNNLKLRASYGKLGNDRIEPFRYIEVFSFNEAFIDDGNVSKTLSSNGIPDPLTTWEKAETYNLGIELGLWNNLFSLETDLFYKRTTDILTSRALEVPSTFGGQLPLENIGIVDNKGIDIILNHNNTIKDFTYFVNFNFGYAKNEIIDIAESESVSDLLRQTGRSLGTRYGYLADGLFLTQQEIDDLNANAQQQTGDAGAVYQTQNPQPGDIKYVDVTGDGIVNADDRTVIGRGTTPEISYGINLGFSYKQFDFSALFQGAANFDMYLSQEASWAFFNGGKVFDKHLGRAQIGTDGNVINPDASYPRLTLANNAVNERVSSYWVEAGDYLRFKNLEIGYTLPYSIAEKIGLDKFRVYLNGRNLFTISDIKQLDPENPQQRGWFYPQQKVYSLGFNIQL